MTPLATIPAFEVRIADLGWGENNVPGGNEEPPLGAPTFSDEEAPCSFDVLRMLGTYGDAERGRQRLLDACGGVGSEAGLEELRASRLTHGNGPRRRRACSEKGGPRREPTWASSSREREEGVTPIQITEGVG
jgi:hypothetical protein